MTAAPEKHFWRHRIFQAGMVLKGIDGVLELIGGVLLLFVTKVQLNAIAAFLTQHELAQDPDDRIANFILLASQHLSANAKLFGAVYLLLHGVIKLFIVVQLLREKLWAFPVSLAILAMFIFYQLYRLSHHFSYTLLVFIVVDLIVCTFVWLEYTERKKMFEAKRVK